MRQTHDTLRSEMRAEMTQEYDRELDRTRAEEEDAETPEPVDHCPNCACPDKTLGRNGMHGRNGMVCSACNTPWPTK